MCIGKEQTTTTINKNKNKNQKQKQGSSSSPGKKKIQGREPWTQNFAEGSQVGRICKDAIISDSFNSSLRQGFRLHQRYHDDIEIWVVATGSQDEEEGGDTPKEEWGKAKE